jgi:ElaB/YqjD/DUF883 family membrane-anchored ribosome-binding protein
MAQRTGHNPRPFEERRATVTEQLESVGARVQETAERVSSAAEHARKGGTQVQEAVDGAKAAVEEVLGRVHVALQDMLEGAKTMAQRMDPAQIEQNPWAPLHATAGLIEPARVHHTPWILIGSAIALGYLLGTLECHSAAAPDRGEP